LLVRIPEPFSFELTTERYRAFGPDLANLWDDGHLYRVFDGRELSFEPAAGGVLAAPAADGVVGDVQRYFGAPFDLDDFARFATRDPVLARIVPALRGLRPPLAPDPFEALVSSISAQQVSLKSAFAVRGRLIRTFGTPFSHAFGFPKREVLAAAEPGELTALGFSRRKAEYIVSLARSSLDFEGLALLPDDEVKAALVGQRGLGEWTADWFLARHLGRPDAWPAGDLGLRKAVSAFYFDGRDVATGEVRAFGERFGPYRNLAAHHLLAALRLLTP
jgi:3-methyladenine DNA glycosylase/8-oxoguanine DNA glycosylase